MPVQQVSVFLENRSGRLAAVTQMLGENGLNIRALSLADTSDFGVLRLIVDDPVRARDVLKAGGFAVSVTDVIAVELPDRPGGLASVLDPLERAGVDVEYLYAFCARRSDEALVIVRVEDAEQAAAALGAGGVRVLSAGEVYRI
jgi:hypothetical protein